MPTPVFDTPLTRAFKITHPLLAGGLMWLSDARYVAAVVRAGGMAFITPRSFDSEADFAAQLALCSQLCQGLPFGVNLSWSAQPEHNVQVPRHLALALDHGVRHFETVGPQAPTLFDRIHAAGGLVVHKAGALAHAQAAERQGADLIALVGMEAGGHPGMNTLPASVLCAQALDVLQVPLVMGGGIGHGRQVAAALALGCAGVLLGSRLLACDELWSHGALKDRYVSSTAQDSTVVLRGTGAPWRVLNNATARQVAALEAQGLKHHADFGELVQGRTGRDGAYALGDTDRGLLSMGPAVAWAHQREPVAQALQSLMDQAAVAAAQAAGRFAHLLRPA